MKSKLFVFVAVLISLTSCGEDVVYSRKHSTQRTDISYMGTSGEETSISEQFPAYNTSYAPAVSTVNSEDRAVKIFDKYIDYEVLHQYTVYIREFSDNPFYVRTDGYFEYVNTRADSSINENNYALYLYDVNGDGYRDFAWVYKDTYTNYYCLCFYNIRYKTIFYLNEGYSRGDYSYFLETKNGDLYIRETQRYYTDETIGYGIFDLKEGEGYIQWRDSK